MVIASFVLCISYIVCSLYLNFNFWPYIAMGNEKANSYWEAELPPNYDRVGIENFIRAKYVS